MSAWPDRRLIDRLGLRAPIIQAPMAGASSAEMVAGAVAGGGLGSIPCATLTPDAAREMTAKVRALAAGPVALNFFCHTPPPEDPAAEARWRARLDPYYRDLAEPEENAPPLQGRGRGGGHPRAPSPMPGAPPPSPPLKGRGESPPDRAPFDAAMCAVVEGVRPEAVSFHFGLPNAALFDRVRATGAFVFATATTPAEAEWLAARGVDAIVAQGYEAGGHHGWFLEPRRSPVGTMALVPQIRRRTTLPVVAAGGIADGHGIAAALVLGAAAVQIGTAYLFTPEAPIRDFFRAALGDAQPEETVLTNVISGREARGIVNRVIAEVGPLSGDAPAFPLAARAVAPLRSAAEARGLGDFSTMWAGQGVGLAPHLPARELTERLAADALARLKGIPMLEVAQVAVLSDNYVYLVHDSASGETAVVDPAVAEPVLAEANRRGWRITQILNTHWHPDHVGGNLEIKAATGCTITGPKGEAEKIPGIDRAVAGGDAVLIGGSAGRVIDVPGHTAGHNAYHFADDGLLFCGDTLFAMGCGRLFEGTPAQMHDSLDKLMALPDATQVYCAHEYTAANGRFALTVEPGNAALVARMDEVAQLRAAGRPTVPSTIARERATNPFTRAVSVEDFAERRVAKDNFRG